MGAWGELLLQPQVVRRGRLHAVRVQEQPPRGELHPLRRLPLLAAREGRSAPPARPRRLHSPTPFTAERSAGAGTNFTVVVAAIRIVSPVFGLRPARSARADCLKLPNPGITTCPPRASSSARIRISASRFLEASACELSVAVASVCTSSDLFMASLLRVRLPPPG